VELRQTKVGMRTLPTGGIPPVARMGRSSSRCTVRCCEVSLLPTLLLGARPALGRGTGST
jgi:hypothetical protein